ncbi:MAG: hypothetical protein R3C01_07540 [Planctomycetaceae bacterium]
MNNTATLTERLHDWHQDLTVDRTSRLVKNVALTGRDSKNGYRYSEAALQAAVVMYDHKPVFLDHAADKNRPHERSTRDLVGSIVNPRFESGRIRGDIRVLDTESGRHFLAMAEADTPGVGMSHVVVARRSADGQTVEQIADVVSVDAVINPATTTTFKESVQTGVTDAATLLASESAVSPLSPPGEQCRQDEESVSPSTPLRVTESSQTTPVEESEISLTEQLQQERDSLLKRLHQIEQQREQEAREQRMEALLLESSLPQSAITPFFKEQLRQAPTENIRQQLIEDRRALVSLATTRHPLASERTLPVDNSPRITEQFLQAIKRH